MQCKEFASVLEQQGLSPLPDSARDHLAVCTDCQNFLADISLIVATAKQLPAEADPPQRVWVSLRAQLEAEGLVREPAVAAQESAGTWLQNLRALFTPRTLATAGVGIALAVAAFLQLHKPAAVGTPSTPVAAAQKQVPPETPAQATQTQAAPNQIIPAVQQPLRLPLRSAPANTPALASAPSEDVYFARSAALNQAESDVPNSSLATNPALDEALRKNLRTVNEFIAECEAHLKKHPQDTLAREYLNSAYQQKAELLAAMLDSGRSEQ